MIKVYDTKFSEQEIADKFQNCTICPRNCGVNRSLGETGYCRQGAKLTAARAYLHAWEEPCISGEKGSGTVFFSGCNMRCVFCQNSEIASGEVAKTISVQRLTEIFLELQDKEASNINLVTPTHFVPLIIPAIEKAKVQGLHIPIVYNTSAYEKAETLKMLDGLIDIYLPDCKYYSDALALRYSNAPGYFKIAMDAISEMIRQVGEPLFLADEKTLQLNVIDSDRHTNYPDIPGMLISASAYNDLIYDLPDDYSGPLMKRGVIVRHLMLPGQLSDSKRVVKNLLEHFGSSIYLSIMNQFTPHGDLSLFPELSCGISGSDYEELIDYAIDQGIENGFFQGEGTDSESFIPIFDFEGI